MIIEKQNGQIILICDCCHKFKSFDELMQNSGASSLFVPDTDAPTVEEHQFHCVECTENYGMPVSFQHVEGIVQKY